MKKRIIFSFFVILMFSFVLSACTVTQVEQDQYDEEIYAIYILAQEEGYEG